ncbi:MAG: AbrB/MazE/SpoVT family DNA-binding domain-containing protein [Arenimonas sp.]|nr:AbrB/MazE/SpoVT family DNA-binding domain-containing protein [Arenimonas sp.]MBP7981483.1 AbrB/MazE/SpoVT family DNA-binding domain-containing protein [Arenimonas sp.]
METTKLSSKGQVIIPKAVRSAHQWQAGLELVVVDLGDGILLKPRAPFEVTALSDVTGFLKNSVQPKTDQEIKLALQNDIKSKWHAKR